MSRAFDERIILYFYKKVSTTTAFLFVMAAMLTWIGYSRGTNSPFFIIGIALFLLWLWQLVRTFATNVKGEEVDESVRRFKSNTNLRKNAYDALNLDEEDVQGAEVIQLDGYCCLAIETEPLYRWDEEDQQVRASNYQLSCFFLDKDALLTYTEVKSLVDSEYHEGTHIWRLAGITDVSIEKMQRRCRISSKKDSEKVEKDFDVLIITDENGERRSYAIGKEQMELAEHIRDAVLRGGKVKSRLRKPVRRTIHAKTEEINYELLDKKEKEALQIGMIGENLNDL